MPVTSTSTGVRRPASQLKSEQRQPEIHLQASKVGRMRHSDCNRHGCERVLGSLNAAEALLCGSQLSEAYR